VAGLVTGGGGESPHEIRKGGGAGGGDWWVGGTAAGDRGGGGGGVKQPSLHASPNGHAYSEIAATRVLVDAKSALLL
jgi:hypothetical protein